MDLPALSFAFKLHELHKSMNHTLIKTMHTTVTMTNTPSHEAMNNVTKWEIEFPYYHSGSSKTKNTYIFKSESSQQREATVTA